MKKTIIFITIVALSFNAFSQISTNEIPPSFKEKLEKNNISTITMPALNFEIIDKEDSIDNQNGLPPRFGFDFDVDINMENSGRWIDLPNNKGKIWQLEIYCPGALSINLLYDKFYIPEGGKFFIYSPDKNKKLGAFTHRNNKGDKIHPGAFASSLILNDRIILEYYTSTNSNDIPIISINKVVHGYRYIPLNFGDSDGRCEININCSLGANWQDEKTSVALIVVGGNRWCTGSLINNTLGDGTPFLLTADHCINLGSHDAISNPNLPNWTFLWNYESPTCANGTDFTPPSTSGATVVANNPVTDFALLKLDETPFDLTPSLCLYYSGWDKSGSKPSNSTCIHHPRGDIKKISVSNSTSSGDNNKWRVVFNQGIVEGGSSGSPLFDQNSRVVGQLIGSPLNDFITCLNPDGPAIYGKFSVSWNNSTDPRRRLKDWLDPTGTNPNTLDGAYLFPTNNTSISGPSVVCSSGAAFTINNLPPVDSIIWSSEPHLSISSGQNTASCTFSATGVGSSWVRARLVNDCGDVTLPQKTVWVGKPHSPIITSDNSWPYVWIEEPGYGLVKKYTVPVNLDIVFYDENNYGGLVENFNWTWYLDDGGKLHDDYDYGIGGKMYIFYEPGSFRVRAICGNGCGSTSLSAPVYFDVIGEEFLLVLSPNPSTSETTVSIESTSKEAQSFDEAAEWDLEVYNQSQLLKTKKNKLKGREYTLNTSAWKPGVYIVRVNYNGEILTEKLVVKE